MFSFYKRSYQRSESIFSKGASNEGKYGNMEKFKEINFYRTLKGLLLDLIKKQQSSLILSIVLDTTFSKLYHLGNCPEQASMLFMETLTNGTLNKSIEIIHVHGKSKTYYPPEFAMILGKEEEVKNETHSLVVHDRDMASDIDNPASWKDAYASDTWGKKLFGPKEINKKNLGDAGRLFFGEVKISSFYRRDSFLSEKECKEIINDLTTIQKLLSKELISFVHQNSKPSKNIDDIEKETVKIKKQIDLEIEIFKKLIINPRIKIDDLLIKHWEKIPNYSEADFVQQTYKK